MDKPTPFDLMRRNREQKARRDARASREQYADLWPHLEAEAFAKHHDSEQLAVELREIDMDAVYRKTPWRWWHLFIKPAP